VESQAAQRLTQAPALLVVHREFQEFDTVSYRRRR
jgi:hypothetical protein